MQLYRLPGSSPQLSLNHLALRRSPLAALQNQTDNARDRAQNSTESEEGLETLVNVQRGDQGDGSDHGRDSTQGETV